MSKPKKKFGQTTVGKLLKASIGLINPTLGSIIQGDMSVDQVVTSIKNSDAPAADKVRAQEMVLDAYQAEVEDRASARQREIGIKQTGNQDWMMFLTGIIGLASFVFLIYAVVYVEGVTDNDLFVHLMGMVEGVVISNIFAYYYGTSSQDRKR